MTDSSGYQRRYLRAPFKQEILFVDQDFVFKGKSLNISERGILLDEVGHFPDSNSVGFMIKLPQFPLLKNFNLERLRNYNPEHLEDKVIRFSATLARKINIQSRVEGVFISQIGLKIDDISQFNQAKVANYVDVFSSNLIYLQVLIDTINSDKNNLEKIRIVSEILGYSKYDKISLLRKIVEIDYKGLQWL